ncbi:GIY-YIG nuclease family protein [Flavobacterium davisii]|uniref:GIY-YIG nuclease family protein n=1 Tax=Flavobacterium columnare TaxID=996 RepID=A0A8G0KW35_9FLAO|nr:GIY-YIG nuclease family protein [Flavobacterium davisii]
MDPPAGRQEHELYYTYVLLCNDGSYYKGFTKNLDQRYQQHLSGNGAEHTKKHKPVKLVYYETFNTERQAIEREKYFKTGSGREWLASKIKSLEA